MVLAWLFCLKRAWLRVGIRHKPARTPAHKSACTPARAPARLQAPCGTFSPQLQQRRRPGPRAVRPICAKGARFMSLVPTGMFAADAQVQAVNDRPVTIPMRVVVAGRNFALRLLIRLLQARRSLPGTPIRELAPKPLLQECPWGIWFQPMLQFQLASTICAFA